jgi:hypothetical protein
MAGCGMSRNRMGIAAQNHAPAPAKAPMAQSSQGENGLACGLQLIDADPKQYR